MKLIKYSFLFICLTFKIVIIFNVQTAYSQQPTDSIVYYIGLINHPQSGDDLIKSYNFFTKEKNNAVKVNDSVNMIFDLFQMARIEYKGGFYSKSEASAVSALKVLDKVKETPYNTHLRTSLFTHLGILYREQKNKVKALELYEKALVTAKSPEDSVKLYNNKSNAHKDINDYETAKIELSKAYELIPRITDTSTIALVLDNLGFIKYKLKEPDALPLMMNALKLRMHSKNQTKAYPSYKNLANYFYDTDPIKARSYALKAYDIATTLNSASYRMDALSLLMEFSNDDYAKAYQQISDSIYKAEKFQENEFSLMKYDLSEKEREAQESELVSQKEKTNRQFYQFLTVLIVVIAFGLYRILKTQHKKDNLQKVYDTETRISKKVHDDVANNVFQVMTKLQHQNASEDVLDDLDDIYKKTRDISKEHSVMDFDDKFENILGDLLMSYRNNTTNIMAKDISKIKWASISNVKRETIYKVLQELLINMTKHSQATLAVISFDDIQNKIVITYKDNGMGCTLVKNTGLQNVENRISAMKGTVIFESVINSGFKATIKV
ncbi:MAG: hypothetical protein WA749_13660 [Gelidibacter sp.]